VWVGHPGGVGRSTMVVGGVDRSRSRHPVERPCTVRFDENGNAPTGTPNDSASSGARHRVSRPEL
ncbi:hypothetical protein SCJ90_03185, partial [Haloferax volcanii]|uniref:hypothetical protein n=1 Tax=Haloferax volcanii TaxID=2246 RepID=UPI00298E53A5